MTRHRPQINRLFLSVLLAALATFLSPANAYAQSAFEDPGVRTAGGGGDLSAVQANIEAGDVALGSSSQIVVLFRNDDSKPLTVGEIRLYPSSNVSASIAENQCAAEPLAPEAVCAVAFSVKGLQSGKFRIEILVRHDGRARLLTASIAGNVDATGNTAGQRNSDLETAPEQLDFGSLNASRPQVRSVLLRNITSQSIEIYDVTIQANPQAGFSLEGDCPELSSGGACVLSVTWAPKQIGPATGSILISHSGPTGVANVSLSGTYSPSAATEATVFPDAVPGKGLLVSSLKEISFGSGIEKSSSITVSLVNAGDAPLTLTGLHLTNSENGLVIEKDGCAKGGVLEPIEACPLTLTWSPVRAGDILDDVQIAHTGARGILVLPVRGSATQGVSRDSGAIVLGGDGFDSIPPLSVSDIEGAISQGSVTAATPQTNKNSLSSYEVGDVRGLLDGYKITSLATNRAIVSGPGGSRVVFDGENTVIGGVPWVVTVKSGAVQFDHAGQTIVLLFDKSLSFVNQSGSQSGGGGTSSSSVTESVPVE
ncbi:MAG: choice-of-anchor D domain-containing protein [Alphaproteobacteria bacterium]|nr:choice-of-anchor D domain-containing protein [Alphaproteobacteria bacterium]